MKKLFNVLVIAVVLSFILTSCGANNSTAVTSINNSNITDSETTTQAEATTSIAVTEPKKKVEYASEMLDVEKSSIIVGKLSPEHEFYNEVVTLDPECAQYINEISIYDKEIDDTFVIHVSLPPEYDSSKKYPMIVMTDGVWRLSDHPELRPLMKDGQIDPVIMVSIGYPNGYDYRTIRERDLIEDPESYLHFIIDNLVPYLSEQYSVDSENMTLTGHSYGGYWGFYALFNSDTIGKNTFKNYYIGSPSFQASTGKENIASFEEAYHLRNTKLDCNVYVTAGSLENYGFIKPITDFIDFLNERNYDGLKLTYEIIDSYNHNNVFKPSIKNTMIMFYGKQNNQG